MKKVFIIYATAGEGHRQAAIAVKESLQDNRFSNISVHLIDALDYTNSFFKWSYSKGYLFIVNKLPFIWGAIYYLLDIKLLYPIVFYTRRIINKLNTSALVRLLRKENPDIVICTHFLAAEVISNLKKRQLLHSRLIVIVTDYRMHAFWYFNMVDQYLVGFELTKQDIVQKWHHPDRDVFITGIPVRKKFYKKTDRLEIRRRLGLLEQRFTVLIASGGFGIGPIKKIVLTLAQTDLKLQLLVVCGHNLKLYHSLKEIYEATECIRIYDFVENINEFMRASNLIIAKSGGLICSEALVSELPILVIAPIPGQESRNCRFLLSQTVAIKLNNISELNLLIRDLQSNPYKLELIKSNINLIVKKDTIQSIQRLFLSCLYPDKYEKGV